MGNLVTWIAGIQKAGRLGLTIRRCKRMAAFARSRSATAAVEFAIMLPVAMMLYVGAAEVTDGVMASRRVSTVTKTLVDLLSLQGTTTQLVRWSYTQGSTLRPCAVQMTALPSSSYYSATQIPAGLLPYGTQLPAPLYVIISDVSYKYQAYFSQNMLKFAPTMQRSEYMLPRSMGQVTTSALPSTGSQYGQVCY